MKDTKEKRQKSLKELTEQLEQSIRSFMDGDRYKEFLGKMSRFHRYSLNNQILIAVQKPEATLCASYTTWKKQGRYVKKGEKGIRILCPAPYKVQALENEKDPETGKDRLMKDGKPYQKKVEVVVPAYKVGYTYDISQTDGEKLPELVSILEGSLDNSQKVLRDVLLEISPVPVFFRPVPGNANGFYDRKEREIVVDERLPEMQALKTLIHEMGHAILHNAENKVQADSATREVQAESVAYIVCQHFGIDTSEYSFGYISGWSSKRDVPELRMSLDIIRTTANDIIGQVEQILAKTKQPEEKMEIFRKTAVM